MDEWLEDDLDLLTGGEPAPRVLDHRMIREPIRYLAPRPPLCLAPSDTVIDAIRTMREHRAGWRCSAAAAPSSLSVLLLSACPPMQRASRCRSTGSSGGTGT